ncbi:cupin domain-containing protein [Pectinatus sottacetonis]|nr:hypothetical protein [Pectinatus sottacetonis]
MGNSFVRSHKENEDLYVITNGSGRFFVDGEEFSIRERSMIRVVPC